MSFEFQEELARQLMRRNGVVCIHKVPRAGATLSTVKVAIEEGRKIVVFVPNFLMLKRGVF